jgi:Hypoxia induced protein conserved region
MQAILAVLLVLALGAVAVTLAFGFYALSRGGDFGRKWSNKLMRLRIMFQFVAIVLLAAIFWLSRRH